VLLSDDDDDDESEFEYPGIINPRGRSGLEGLVRFAGGGGATRVDLRFGGMMAALLFLFAELFKFGLWELKPPGWTRCRRGDVSCISATIMSSNPTKMSQV
jgi:hypothetical protein